MGHNLEFIARDSQQTSLLCFKALQGLRLILSTNIDELDKLARGETLQKNDNTIPSAVSLPRKNTSRTKIKTKTVQDTGKDGFIRKVDGPTDWASSMVRVENLKTLRICFEPINFNNTIRLEYFQLHTIEEITSRISGA